MGGLGGIFRSCPLTSQKLPLCGNHQTQRILGQFLRSLLQSEKLEKAGTVDFKKYPARKVGTRSRQCLPKVPGRFAFPGAPNPRIRSISQFGKIFPASFPAPSRSFLENPRTDPGNSHSLLEFSDSKSPELLISCSRSPPCGAHGSSLS